MSINPDNTIQRFDGIQIGSNGQVSLDGEKDGLLSTQEMGWGAALLLGAKPQNQQDAFDLGLFSALLTGGQNNAPLVQANDTLSAGDLGAIAGADGDASMVKSEDFEAAFGERYDKNAFQQLSLNQAQGPFYSKLLINAGVDPSIRSLGLGPQNDPSNPTPHSIPGASFSTTQSTTQTMPPLSNPGIQGSVFAQQGVPHLNIPGSSNPDSGAASGSLQPGGASQRTIPGGAAQSSSGAGKGTAATQDQVIDECLSLLEKAADILASGETKAAQQ